MTRPTIAAVVVNYNYARYLPDAVDSVLGQHVAFDEVIVVDDGSTDDSLRSWPGTGTGSGFSRSLTAASSAHAAPGWRRRRPTTSTSSTRTTMPIPISCRRSGRQLADSPVKVQFQLKGVSSTAEALQSVFPTFPTATTPRRCVPTTPPSASTSALRRPATSTTGAARCSDLPLDMLDQRDFIDGPATLALPYIGEIGSVNLPLASYRVHADNHSQWSEPTAELLTHEMDWFRRRWTQTSGLLGRRRSAVRRPGAALPRRARS